MILQLSDPKHLPGKAPATFVRTLAQIALSAALIAAVPAAVAADNVYVAGQGNTVDQAFTQALAENAGKTKNHFWIVVAGPDVARFTKAKAGAGIAERVKTVRARGGVVFVCRSDLNRQGVREEDLLDGVASVYGYGTQDWAGLLPAKREEGLAMPKDMKQSELILKTCSGDAKGSAQ